VRVRPLAEALDAADRTWPRSPRSRTALSRRSNTALFDEAVVVEIERGAHVAEADPAPLRRRAGTRRPAASFPRVLVLARAGSQASIVEAYAGADRRFFRRGHRDRLEDGAILEHTKLQTEGEETFHLHTLAAGLRATAVHVAQRCLGSTWPAPISTSRSRAGRGVSSVRPLSGQTASTSTTTRSSITP
jgi:Fe-S cluster assembly scaffold protein SufB